MKRRGYRRRHVHRSNALKTRAISFVMIICFSVASGYLTATYLIGPFLGLETEAISFDFMKNETEDQGNKDREDDKDTEIVQDKITVNQKSGYALQYGSFSSMAGAEECAEELEGAGIPAEIIEKDGSYKVIGEVFNTKAETEKSKARSMAEEVFITQIP